MSILRCYCKPSSTSAVCVKPLFYASLVKLHIRRGRGGGVRWGVEVTEALLGQVSVLVVVEGLTWQLAEEVGPEPGAACGMALIWGTVGGCQRLRAAATVYTTEERRKEITDSQLRLNNFLWILIDTILYNLDNHCWTPLFITMSLLLQDSPEYTNPQHVHLRNICAKWWSPAAWRHY